MVGCAIATTVACITLTGVLSGCGQERSGTASSTTGSFITQDSTHLTVEPGGADSAMVARGRYLVTIIACNDCHTPFKMGPNGPEPDMSRMLSGHPQDMKMPAPPALAEGPWIGYMSATNTAFAGPWGITFAANLTPDTQTGLGIWTEEMFVKALREGKHMGISRPIMPPMPWQQYSHMTEDDLRSIYQYLRTIPAVSNEVPAWLSPDDLVPGGYDQ